MKKTNDIKITLNLNQIIIVLLIVGSFLLGSMWSKLRNLKGGETVKITQEGKNTPTTPPQPAQPQFEPKKSNKPQAKFFVMAYCPYGIQAEEGLGPVYELLKNKVDWQPRYVIYKDYCANAPADQKATCEKTNCFKSGSETYCSMHGVVEFNQDIREICAFKMGDLDKWWKFVNAKNKNCTVANIETCWKAQATGAGLNAGQIESCFNGQKLALAKEQTAEMEKYKAMGSPMVFINDVSYDGGRAPEDYKKAICNSFENQPEECKTVLGSESPAAAGGCN